jgi:DNA-binding transcriptional regulator GbsR (MarR family)
MLDAHRCGLDELAVELDVSRASISTNVRLLQGMGLIERITVPGDRRDYWQIPDPSSSLLAVGIRRMRVMLNATREMRKMAKATSLTDGRMAQIEQLYDEAISHGERLLTRWQQRRRK